MRFICSLCLSLIISLTSVSLFASYSPTVESIGAELQLLEDNKGSSPDANKELLEIYQRALHKLNEVKQLQKNITQYQDVIDNYQTLVSALQIRLKSAHNQVIELDPLLTLTELEQLAIQTNSQLLEQSHKMQKQQDLLREMSESLTLLPSQQSQAGKMLLEQEKRLRDLETSRSTSPIIKARIIEAQSDIIYYYEFEKKLAIQQLSTPNRQTLLQHEIDILKAQYKHTERLLLQQRSQTNTLRLEQQKRTEQLANELATSAETLPEIIKIQLSSNQALSEKLIRQANRLDQISNEGRFISQDILKVRDALNALREQAQWLNMSTDLGEIQRAQLARLPKAPEPQSLDPEMAAQRVEQISLQQQLKETELFRQKFNDYEEAALSINELKRKWKIPTSTTLDTLSVEDRRQYQVQYQAALLLQNQLLQSSSEKKHTPTTEIFIDDHLRLMRQQNKNEIELITALLSNNETIIVELAQLKVLRTQLSEALSQIKQAAHKYMFWTADVPPIRLDFPVLALSSLTKFLSLNTVFELSKAIEGIFENPRTSGLILAAALLVIFNLTSRRHYTKFLERASAKIGKVTQDSFSLTLRTLIWSIVIALPLPILWAALSYGLQEAWQYPIAIAIGKGIESTLPIMWAFMICASFAHPKGLFIVHLEWAPEKIGKLLPYYKITVWFVVPLMIALISCDTYNDREFASTLGRICFFLLCVTLFIMITHLRRAGVTLSLNDKNKGAETLINDTLWLFLRYAPIAAAIAAAFGYLATAQTLLARLNVSVVIWLALLIVYHIIRRWMLIQRRRIAFERAKQKRAERLAQRAKTSSEEESAAHLHLTNSDGIQEIEEPVVDLDTISAQSLALVRSILTMIGLVSIIALWSELHSAFSFLENIHLWDVSSTIQGVESSQPITLASVLIAIIIFIVTAQLIRNFPALLELTILQHLDLSPGTGYAIITVTKYILALIGSMIAFSIIGVDWSKLQWLIAALGVGLGFGLQEIFANFVSGLIILFEKPIRINDMVTIRELTGTVTKINTRATTILDWDRKEIIVPNKAFITEQFINWSLTDSITRVVITVPAEIDVDPNLVVQLLKDATAKCSLVIPNPPPEAYLVDVHQGIQLFELRAFASDTSHRLPLRHELHQIILKEFKTHNLTMPFPPLQIKEGVLSRTTVRKHYTTGGV